MSDPLLEEIKLKMEYFFTNTTDEEFWQLLEKAGLETYRDSENFITGDTVYKTKFCYSDKEVEDFLNAHCENWLIFSVFAGAETRTSSEGDVIDTIHGVYVILKNQKAV